MNAASHNMCTANEAGCGSDALFKEDVCSSCRLTALGLVISRDQVL